MLSRLRPLHGLRLCCTAGELRCDKPQATKLRLELLAHKQNDGACQCQQQSLVSEQLEGDIKY